MRRVLEISATSSGRLAPNAASSCSRSWQGGYPHAGDVEMSNGPGHAEHVAWIRERLARGGYGSRTRTLAEIDERLASTGTTLERAIEQQLGGGRPVAVLEIGFGWGPVLIALAWRFRDEPASF